MSSGSVCQVSRSWVDVGSSHTRLVKSFMNFTASVRNILDTPSSFFHRLHNFVITALLCNNKYFYQVNSDMQLKSTFTHTKYIVAFSLQQWLRNVSFYVYCLSDSFSLRPEIVSYLAIVSLNKP
jgi:hypothetical protein